MLSIHKPLYVGDFSGFLLAPPRLEDHKLPCTNRRLLCMHCTVLKTLEYLCVYSTASLHGDLGLEFLGSFLYESH